MPKMTTPLPNEQDRRALAEFESRDRILAQRIDAELHRSARTTATTAAAAPGLDFDALQTIIEKMNSMPLAPLFGSSVLFPADSATCFKHGRRQYALAHPDFWRRLPEEKRAPLDVLRPLASIEILDLDDPRNRGERTLVFDAMRETIKDALDG